MCPALIRVSFVLVALSAVAYGQSMQEQFAGLVGSHLKLMAGDMIDDMKVESVTSDQFCGHYSTSPELGGGPYKEGDALCIPFANVARFEKIKPNLDRVYLKR